MKKFSFLVVMLAACITLQAQEEISVSRAIEITEALAAGASTTQQYIVKGVVSEINTTDEGIATYKNCDFWMSDRDNATLKIKAFRTKGIAGLDFTVGMIAVGDTVKVQGVLMHYVNTTTSEELLEIYKGNLVEVVVGGNAIYYKFDDANLTATVTYRGSYYNSYANEYKGDVVIPATVTYRGKTYSVTSIGKSAFSGCSGLTSVTIPNSVTNIEYQAFGDCSGLTSVTIPNSVTSIGDYAFDGCSGLTSVTIGNSVTSIGSYAFDGCSSLTSVTIGNSVTSIGSYAFGYCSGLTSVVWNAKNCADCSSSYGSDAPFYNIKSQITSFTFGSEVEHIPAYLCYGMENLTSVTIPNSVTSIGDRAFYNCSGLTSVLWNAKNFADFEYSSDAPFCYIQSQITSFTFGSEVEHIPAYLCYGMENLTSVTIGNSVTSIGSYAFSGCSGLTSVTIPNSVTNIGYSAFSGCSGLTSVTIGNSVTSIGDYAFEDCSGLTSVTIPNSVTSIGDYAFSGCSGLTSVTIPNSVTSIGNYAFSGCSGLTSVTIGNSVTSIGRSAFYGCSGLTSVTIPNSVTSIGQYAFWDCSGLTSVAWNAKNCADFSSTSFDNASQITSFTFGSEVEHIPANLCYDMENLTSVTIPNSVTSIGDYAFSGCSGLTSVTIGNSVTSIGQYAFSRCTKLTNIVCYAAEPPSCGAYVFANYYASLKVPCSSLEAYKAAAVWGSFNNISCIGSTVGLEQIELAGLYTQAGRIVCEGEFRIYDLLGRDVTRLNGSLSGVYVVKTANAAQKVIVK